MYGKHPAAAELLLKLSCPLKEISVLQTKYDKDATYNLTHQMT